MTKEDLYIDLIVNKCVSLKKSKNVLISYNNFNEPFVQKLVDRLKTMGAKDIYLDVKDPFYEHELLSKLSLEEIEKSNYFSEDIYNTYAKKNAAFIFIVSPIPGIFNDIDDEKLALVSKIKSESKRYFVYKETSYKISWTIIPLYNEYWESALGIKNLEKVLYDICMVDEKVLENWNDTLKKAKVFKDKLNSLKLDYLVYTNSLGTNLKVGLPKGYIYETAGDEDVLVNMPSYEVFTSPDYRKTDGIVYSSKPLYYNGAVIEEFNITFKDGKAVEWHAKKGEKLLESIIKYDDNSCYLGEAALVEYSSKISKTNIIFKTTLLDENASCHLALGCGFGKGSKSSLLKRGINQSKVHVDFMIGTPDLKIVGYKDGREVLIMENGDFVI